MTGFLGSHFSLFSQHGKTQLTVSSLHLDNLLREKLNEVPKNSFEFYLSIHNYLQNDK